MYLVIGANGFLGSYVLKNIMRLTDDKIIAVARNLTDLIDNDRTEWISCDITDFFQVDQLCERVQDHENLKVIFLAAYHNPDEVENNSVVAWNTNVTSLSYFINQLGKVKCLFYPSTDSVYGNTVNNYHFKEEDALAPVNKYGMQKCAAEGVVRWHGYNVVRYPFLIAPSLVSGKKHFYDLIVNDLLMGKKVKMFSDSFRSSINFDTAACLLIKLMEHYSDKFPKILNICGDEDLSKYDVGIRIAEKLGVTKKLIVPVLVREMSDIFQAKRAASTLMDNSVLKKLLGIDEIKLTL